MRAVLISLFFCGTALQASAHFTESPSHTVTYNPGQECLAWDGSVVPDCWDAVDQTTGEPVFHIHSANCSRFWLCGPEGETCLFECAHCGGPSNPLCQEQWALTFDPRYQYPVGPVCDWPGNIECTIGCPLGSECCENTACNKCGDGYCNLDWTCTYPDDCCASNSDCETSDGVCNVPAPHTPDNCAYCDDGQCLGGCSDLDNCPENYECNLTSHECEQSVCDVDSFCAGFDQLCNAEYDNCFFCGGDCAAVDGCCPGCHDDGLNCAYPQPVCDQNTHTCGCQDDNDCNVGDFCNTDTNTCEPTCADNHECVGFDEVCNAEYDNCFFCGGGCGSVDGCCPGCHDDDLNCAYPQPICNQNTNTCGCQDDSDCNVGDYCNSDTSTCEVTCAETPECVGFDEVCNADYDNCFFCGGDCDDSFGCCPGCHDDGLNCAYPQPVCDQDTHTCGCQDDNDCNVGDFCNTDTNTCEPTCADNHECVGFDEVCNPLYDNCFFCGGDCGDSFGCCPGCHDDGLNCAYPQPVCHPDHTCGCESDDDCEVTDFCNPDTDSCELVPDECTTDVDCNEGLTGVCEAGVAEQTQCNYCTPEGHRNVCKPGCQYDSSSSDIPRCPSASPVCNTETHICQANSGSILLTKMVFSSKGCEGCTKEGVNMTLTGTFLQSPSPQCKTVDLDHPGRVDFQDSTQFLSIPSEQNYGWKNCFNGPLDGLVSAAVVVWTGEGQWSPDTICYDWDKDTQVVSICSFPTGTTLAYGESASATCVYNAGTDCP